MSEMKFPAAAAQWRPPLRSRWTDDDGRAMARAVAASGLSCLAFARQYGLPYERVRRWFARSRESAAAVPSPIAFAPVRVVETIDSARGAVEITVGQYHVRVSSGFCPQTLRHVVAVLGGDSC